MDVLVANQIRALNGTTVKISCTFTSCYKVDNSKFAMNWSYQETANDTKEMVSFFAFTILNHSEGFFLLMPHFVCILNRSCCVFVHLFVCVFI